MSLSPWIFIKVMGVIAMHLRQRTISVFPYLDDWLVKDLIRNRLISQTKYCLQIIQNLGFIPNLKKSELIPAQKFTFIGMESSHSDSSAIQKVSAVRIRRSSSAIHGLTLRNVPNSAKFSQSTVRSSSDLNSDYQINSVMQTSIGTNFPVSFG